MLHLAYELSFSDLYSIDGLARLDAGFLADLENADAALAARLKAARAHPAALARKDESELLIAVAQHLEDFLARLFGIESEVGALQVAQMKSARKAAYLLDRAALPAHVE